MSPEEDIRAVAGSSGLLELNLNLVRMSNSYLNAGFLGVSVTNLGNSVVALIAVNPDGQLVLFDCSVGKKSGSKGSNADQGTD